MQIQTQKMAYKACKDSLKQGIGREMLKIAELQIELDSERQQLQAVKAILGSLEQSTVKILSKNIEWSSSLISLAAKFINSAQVPLSLEVKQGLSSSLQDTNDRLIKIKQDIAQCNQVTQSHMSELQNILQELNTRIAKMEQNIMSSQKTISSIKQELDQQRNEHNNIIENLEKQRAYLYVLKFKQYNKGCEVVKAEKYNKIIQNQHIELMKASYDPLNKEATSIDDALCWMQKQYLNQGNVNDNDQNINQNSNTLSQNNHQFFIVGDIDNTDSNNQF